MDDRFGRFRILLKRILSNALVLYGMQALGNWTHRFQIQTIPAKIALCLIISSIEVEGF